MRFAFFFLLMAFSLLCKGQSLSDTLLRSKVLYDKGTQYLSKEKFAFADSLFAESLKLYPHPDTYYNRAIAKKKLGDMKGFAENLEGAVMMEDSAAKSIYYKKYSTTDTLFVNAVEQKVTAGGLYSHYYVFTRSKYTSYYEVKRTNSSGKIDLQYTVNAGDTIYSILPKKESNDDVLVSKTLKNIKYPPNLRDKGIQGTVWIAFVVNKDGTVGEVTVIRSTATEFSVEALNTFRRVLSEERFTVYKHEGRPVKMKMKFPVRFSIKH